MKTRNKYLPSFCVVAMSHYILPGTLERTNILEKVSRFLPSERADKHFRPLHPGSSFLVKLGAYAHSWLLLYAGKMKEPEGQVNTNS